MPNDIEKLARRIHAERAYYIADVLSTAIVAAIHGVRRVASRLQPPPKRLAST